MDKDLLVNGVTETVEADICLACLKEDIGLEGRTAGGEGQRLLKGLKGLFILGLALSDGAAELQAAFLEKGGGDEGIRTFGPRELFRLDGVFPALGITPGHNVEGSQAAQHQRLPSIGKICGR